MSKALITSASSKFFPSLINMLGSLHKNYPDHPNVYVYDLGLFYTFRKELENIPWVKVVDVPHFAPFWRACYTWKTYMLNTPFADLNFYMDSGCEVLKPLESVFAKIQAQDYFTVSQGTEARMKHVTPQKLFDLYGLEEKFKEYEVITGGIFGFKANSSISSATAMLFEGGVKGLCMGYSAAERWKSKGVNKTDIVPDCKMFRHDTTLISVILYKEVPDLKVEPMDNFFPAKNAFPGQLVWNLRMNYDKLDFTKIELLHKNASLTSVFNRLFIKVFILLKRANKAIKKHI